jgi:hypothetical protein
MSATPRLTEISAALEMQFDDNSLSFFDSETGEVTTVSKNLLDCADDFGAGDAGHPRVAGIGVGDD